MKVAVFGAGAIGAFLGARLAEAGWDVSLIARGDHLAAIRSNGLRVVSVDFGEQVYRLQASDDPAVIGPVDYVILGVKAHSLTAIAPQVAPLEHAETAYISTQNGLPWWYFDKPDERLESVDPGGVILRHIPASKVIGSVVYMSCHLSSPGVVQHTHGVRLPMGEPDGSASARLKTLAEAFMRGGVRAPIRNSIQRELWTKLFGNAVFNPLAALTRKTLVEMTEYPHTRRLVQRAMEETQQVAQAAGVQIGVPVEKRLEGARQAGFHKPSMLQDLEAGRTAELDPLTGSVIELADRLDIPTPTLQAVYAAAKLLFEPKRRPAAEAD